MFKKIILYFLILIISFFVFPSFLKTEAATLTCSDNLSGKVIINEFSSATTVEWVELLNTDESNSINLSNCVLKDGSNNVIKSLSGILPRRGFLTFNLNTNSLTDDGGLIRLIDANNSILSAVSYGTDESVISLDAPNPDQTGYYNLSGSSWAIGSPTKGWCNPGTSNCPTIATIVFGLNSSGIKNNLADQTDYSRISGLYFQKSETNDPDGNPIGKITFLSEMNFTDKDALLWMQNLNSSIDMSTRGKIGLNADLIKNLIATNASLTMYGLTLQNPTIRVTNTDGSVGDSSIVSAITYSAGTLTFTVAHFTTFTAVESSSNTAMESSSKSSSSSLSSPKAPTCDKEAPNKSPHLFQIDTSKNSAKLFFSPVNNAVDYYYIAYGLSEGDERYGVQFNQGYYNGVLDYTINQLSANTKYYFKVRAGNGCATGPWSNWLLAKTDSNQIISKSERTISKETNTPTKLNKEPVVEKNQLVSPTQKPKVKKEITARIDILTPSPIPKLETKLSWWQRLMEFFKGLFK